MFASNASSPGEASITSARSRSQLRGPGARGSVTITSGSDMGVSFSGPAHRAPDQESLAPNACSARSTARPIAAALFTVSMNSSSVLLSATIPPEAWMW